jgi:hypothetical protein
MITTEHNSTVLNHRNSSTILSLPYYWINNFDKLKYTRLPPIESFYNNLENKSYNEAVYQRTIKQMYLRSIVI